MDTLSQHGNSSEKIDKVPTSTPEEMALGVAIVQEELGPAFWLTFGLPRHVGVKGDDRVYGETVLIETDDPEAARLRWEDPEELARISNRITNELPAVVKVIFDLFGQGVRDEQRDIPDTGSLE